MYLAFGFAGLAGPQIAVKLSTGGDYSMAFLAACAISAEERIYGKSQL